MAPKATSVFKRCWMSPLPYLAIIVIVTGAVGAIVAMAIGYAMVYRGDHVKGLCIDGPPGVRRACLLDLCGGVMSMTLGVLLLIIELASAYINQKDWKVALFLIKIVIAVLTIIELGAGTIQGAASYTEYCKGDSSYYLYGYNYRRYGHVYVPHCDFYNDARQHDPDVDFLAVVIVTGINTYFWVILLGTEIFRLCILLMGKKVLQTCILGMTIGRNNNNTQGTETELQELLIASPQDSEV